MKRRDEILPVIEGIILEEEQEMSIGELCRLCHVHADYVLDLIDEGIIEPSGDDMQGYRFHGECVIRIRKAVRLQQDMGMNLAGVAMVLDLLDEIAELKKMIGNELYR